MRRVQTILLSIACKKDHCCIMVRAIKFVAALVLGTVGTVASADTVAPVATPVVATATDKAMRMTVPVTIGTAGPFQFVVDTGSDRTVVSRELAETLTLAQGAKATMHTMTGVEDIHTVIVPTLGLAGRTTRNINAPALFETNLGARGLLGIDSLQGRRIIMDFQAQTLTIAEPGAREPIDPDMIVVTARSKFGQLVLVDADIGGVPITVVIDTGAENSIGNSALRRLLGRHQKRIEYFPTTLMDVTGGKLAAEMAAVDKIRIGGVTLDRIVVAFADAHPFKRFGIDKKPAMLLGMDTLRAFRRVSVDFATRKVRFLLPTEG
jgi:predicted aspartyl protease